MTVDELEREGTGAADEGYRRRGPGPRTRRTRHQRKRQRRRRIRDSVFASLVIAGLMVGASFVELPTITIPRIRLPFDPKPAQTNQRAPAAIPQETWLVIGVQEASPGDADWLTLASHNEKTGDGLMMYVPRSTFVEVPGQGLDTLDKTLAAGIPLTMTTTANLVGVEFDHYLQISDQGLRALVDKIGGVVIDVDQKLTVPDQGRERVVFSEGEQPMDGKRASEFMTFKNQNGDEISRAARHAKVWDAIFTKTRSNKTGLGKLLRSSSDLFTTDASPAQVGSFFDGLTSRRDVIMETLPVSATGVEDGVQLYSPDREGIESLAKRYLAGSRPAGSGRTGRRIEILNGNGVPGIGHDVGQLLISKGFRVVLDQNAKSFDYQTTQIVIYSGSKAAIATADEIKSSLGVGEIIISRQQQSIVDVTIVVGKDYLDKKEKKT